MVHTQADRWISRRGGLMIAREVLVFVVTLGLTGLLEILGGGRRQAILLVLCGAIALAVRRRWPLLAAAIPVVMVAWSGTQVLLIALCYGAGYRVTRRTRLYAWSALYLAAAVGSLVLSSLLGAQGLWVMAAEQLAGFVFVVVLSGLIGQAQAQRKALKEALRSLAEQAERERAIVAEQARLRERARIATDMHDTLGHQLALISVQASSLEVDRTMGTTQRSTGRLLRTTAQTAMDDLRVLVGALMPPDHDDLSRRGREVEDLIERAVASGLSVEVRRAGEPRRLPAMVEHALYRVVQEGLTNAHKHAPGMPVTLTLRYEPGTLVAEVRNRRIGSAPSNGGGQGILGLRERVRLIGGLLRAGPDGADYRIVAIMPYEADAAEMTHGSDAEPTAPSVLPAPSAPPTRPRGPESSGSPVPTTSPARRRAASWLVVSGVVLLMTGSVPVSAAYNTSFLSKSVYEGLRVGQPEQAVMGQLPTRLPPSSCGGKGRHQTGNCCVLYYVHPMDARGTHNANDRYRLCFRDGILMTKQRFPT